MLKVSTFYLEKQKIYIIQAVVSKQAKKFPTDGALLSQFSGKVLSQTFRVPRPPILELYFRAAGISKILLGTSLYGGHNLPPILIEIGFTNLAKYCQDQSSSHVLIRSGGPDILRKSAVCWSTEGRWPLCLLGLSISYTLFKTADF